jgi:hypothetical protein
MSAIESGRNPTRSRDARVTPTPPRSDTPSTGHSCRHNRDRSPRLPLDRQREMIRRSPSPLSEGLPSYFCGAAPRCVVMPIARRGPRSSAACRSTRGPVARHTRKAFLEPTAGMPRSGLARPGKGLAGRRSPLSYFPQSVVLTTGSTSYLSDSQESARGKTNANLPRLSPRS